MSGPDHKASIEIKDFKKMIDLIRTTEKTFGSEIKQPTKSEKEHKSSKKINCCKIKYFER